MLSYRVTLDVPLQLAVFVSGLLAGHRRELRHPEWHTRPDLLEAGGLRAGLVPGPAGPSGGLGPGFGISQATAYRYKDEAVDVLAAKAPTLREALDRAVEQGLPYVILDGTLIASDRCADKKTSRKGKEIDKWYSGKAHRPAGNVQGLAAPAACRCGSPGALPGQPTHDLTARPGTGPPAGQALPEYPAVPGRFRLRRRRAGVLVPVRNPARGDLDIDTKTRDALLRSLRYQGERGFALMKQRWRAIQYVSVSPTTIGDIAKAVLVLVQFEHKMIT